jgi:hypothetical protein
MASLLKPQTDKYGIDQPMNAKDQEDERRILLEVIQLSKLEDDKRSGKLNMNLLKRNRKE